MVGAQREVRAFWVGRRCETSFESAGREEMVKAGMKAVMLQVVKKAAWL